MTNKNTFKMSKLSFAAGLLGHAAVTFCVAFCAILGVVWGASLIIPFAWAAAFLLGGVIAVILGLTLISAISALGVLVFTPLNKRKAEMAFLSIGLLPGGALCGTLVYIGVRLLISCAIPADFVELMPLILLPLLAAGCLAAGIVIGILAIICGCRAIKAQN